MNAQKSSRAQAKNEQTTIMTFQFSESKTEIRNVFVNNEPHFIGSDIANALGYKNVRDALRQHCRYVVKYDIPHPQSKNKKLKVSVIPESDMYRLIMKSTLPSAQKFERWVMEEVLPSIRKKGYYNMGKSKGNFIDARDVPFYTRPINNYLVRYLELNNSTYVVINDVNKAIHSSTSSNQLAKKLNARQQLAIKIWLFGNTHPAWCTNKLGLELMLAGSRKFSNANQLSLEV